LLAEIPNFTPQKKVAFSIEVNTFTSDELFDADGGLCGIGLWLITTTPTTRVLIFS
jgi:hypothetical protein